MPADVIAPLLSNGITTGLDVDGLPILNPTASNSYDFGSVEIAQLPLNTFNSNPAFSMNFLMYSILPGTLQPDADQPGSSKVQPKITNINPSPGISISATQPISFDATDLSGLFRRIIVVATFPGLSIKEIVHDGDSFGPMYSNASNQRSAISFGFHYSIARDRGWPSSPTITPYVIDTDGNENV